MFSIFDTEYSTFISLHMSGKHPFCYVYIMRYLNRNVFPLQQLDPEAATVQKLLQLLNALRLNFTECFHTEST